MKLFLKTKDHSISGEGFELVHDTELDMLITKPQPSDLKKYYESEAYISHTDANKSFVDRIYQQIKKRSLRKKVKLLDTYVQSKKSLLDIGAGTGDFLLAAKRGNYEVFGVEPNQKAAQLAAAKGLTLAPELRLLPKQEYELITLWHVLEHLPNLEEQIVQMKKVLAQNGTLIVAVPNFKSYDARYYKNFWAAYDVPRHLWHFSKTAIQKIFEKHGMQLVHTLPMHYDAFYVSLLSEKYKTGKQNLLKAFWVGLRSNLSAWRSGEYSSHIYVLKKG
ncbi:class I SAM-dependent methyltransferase [Spongiimicrobium sp. 2-473A-2-J]|uniref:class I SAM-dependent methyltransferase n=1 Tax=Eudoraea algarum TaxID=3417568 RepID=UPI003D364735